MNLRSRIGLLSAATAAASTLVVCAVLLVADARATVPRADASLVSASAGADQLARSVKSRGDEPGAAVALDKPLTIGDVTLELLTSAPGPDESTIAGTLTADEVASVGSLERQRPEWRTVDGQRYRVLLTPFGSAGGMVIATWPARAGTQAEQVLALRLAALVLAAALIAGLLGRVVAGRALAPVSRLQETAEHITATGDLGRRIPVTETDELGRLTATVNAMLESLEASVAAQRQLVADASHELRTPLTVLRTNLDLLAEPPGLDDPDAPELVAQAQRQLTELTALVADLVALARYGRAPASLEDVRLDDLVGAVAARSADRPDPHPIRLDLEPTLVHGDAEALARAVSNLVDNAIAWSPPGGAVTLRLRDGRLEVRDEGPGVPPDDVPHVFERFYRSPSARAKPGSGLGLAIVAQVAELHHGSVGVESSPAGSVFALCLPTGDVREPDAGSTQTG